MIVIKLGGSLEAAGTLADCLAAVDRRFAGRAVVIVPGGGLFADQVRIAQRHWQFDDRIAHRMAILAMQQMALLLHGLRPEWPVIGQSGGFDRLNRPQLWSPDPDELDRACVPAGWDVTSDSLAAWLARRLAAEELILVKSAPVDRGWTLRELAERQIVDSAFRDFAADARFNLTVLNQQTFNG